MTNVDIDHLRGWIGREEVAEDVVTRVPVRALSATLDRDDPTPRDGDTLPPLWHWLYFLPVHRQSEIGPDGHPTRGGFLPPVPLPRRMWAGSRVEFRAPQHAPGSLRHQADDRAIERFLEWRIKFGDGASYVIVTNQLRNNFLARFAGQQPTIHFDSATGRHDIDL